MTTKYFPVFMLMSIFILSPAVWAAKTPSPEKPAKPGMDSLFFDQLHPFAEIKSLHERIEKILQKSFSQPKPPDEELLVWPDNGLLDLRTDIQDKGGYFMVRVDLPGMDKDKINVVLKGQTLQISGERESAESQEKKTGDDTVMYMQERFRGEFRRHLVLPEPVTTDNMTANYERGILEVKVMKNKTASAEKKITVQ